jgi:competence protein ComFC
MWMINNIFSKCSAFIIGILFPSYCYVCKKENIQLCDHCLQHFTRAIDTPSPCITSIYSFKDPHIKKIIHAIKYFHRKDLIVPFAKIISSKIQKEKDYTSYTLIPIPMPVFRKYVRGYNHTEALAQHISKEISLTLHTKILRRSHLVSKKRQVLAKSRKERLRNQHNAFTVTSSVQGMNIILLDDVSTTGATLLEARKILLEKGASRVIAYTIAH